MKLGFTAMASKQKPSLGNGSQTCHPDPKQVRQVRSNVKVTLFFFLLRGRNSSWISASWPNGERGILSEGDGKAEKGDEDKKFWFVKGEKIAAPSWQPSGAFLPSDSWFSHKTRDDARPPASVLARTCTSGLLSLHQAEFRPERTTIWACRGDYRIFAHRFTHCSKICIPGMLAKLEETLGAMYKKRKRVLRRVQSPTVPKYVRKWFIYIVRNLYWQTS